MAIIWDGHAHSNHKLADLWESDPKGVHTFSGHHFVIQIITSSKKKKIRTRTNHATCDIFSTCSSYYNNHQTKS